MTDTKRRLNCNATLDTDREHLELIEGQCLEMHNDPYEGWWLYVDGIYMGVISDDQVKELVELSTEDK